MQLSNYFFLASFILNKKLVPLPVLQSSRNAFSKIHTRYMLDFTCYFHCLWRWKISQTCSEIVSNCVLLGTPCTSDGISEPKQPGFPLSQLLTDKHVYLGKAARNLGCQSVHRVTQSEQVGSVWNKEIWYSCNDIIIYYQIKKYLEGLS